MPQPGKGGGDQKKMGWGCGTHFQNHITLFRIKVCDFLYSIYDQNLRILLPYLWPDQTFETLFMTWLLNGGKMDKIIDTLFMTKTAEKPYP